MSGVPPEKLFRDEELLADAICRLIGDVRHVAVGAASPIPATAALLARERTGRGEHVDISMLDGQLSMLTYQASSYLQTGKLFPSGAWLVLTAICKWTYERILTAWIRPQTALTARVRAINGI